MNHPHRLAFGMRAIPGGIAWIVCRAAGPNTRASFRTMRAAATENGNQRCLAYRRPATRSIIEHARG
jgi:hypothetical protein